MQAPEYPKSLAEALTMIRTSGWATAEQLATWAKVNVSTVYSWSELGASDPHFHSIQRIYRLCRDERISFALAHVFLAGGPAVPGVRDILPGPATAEGIKSGIIHSFATVAGVSEKATVSLADGAITAAELIDIRVAYDAAVQSLNNLMRDVEAKAEADAKKKIQGPRGLTG